MVVVKQYCSELLKGILPVPEYQKTKRTTLKRRPKRAVYDYETVHAILDEAYLCHVSAVVEGGVRVQPTCHWRDGHTLFIHGSVRNGMFQALMTGQEACIAVSHLDGLVMARSAMHHSVNYRSVMIYGKARLVDDPIEKREAMRQLIEKIAPGRWSMIRQPDDGEMKVTAVLAFELKEVSAKVRSGSPVDDEADYALNHWAGVVPLQTIKGVPEDDPLLRSGILCPLET